MRKRSMSNLSGLVKCVLVVVYPTATVFWIVFRITISVIGVPIDRGIVNNAFLVVLEAVLLFVLWQPMDEKYIIREILPLARGVTSLIAFGIGADFLFDIAMGIHKGDTEKIIVPFLFFIALCMLVYGEFLYFSRTNWTGDVKYLNLTAYARDEKWLIKHHYGKWVAYGCGRRLAIGSDRDAVFAESKKKKPDTVIMMDQVLREEERPHYRIRTLDYGRQKIKQ